MNVHSVVFHPDRRLLIRQNTGRKPVITVQLVHGSFTNFAVSYESSQISSHRFFMLRIFRFTFLIFLLSMRRISTSREHFPNSEIINREPPYRDVTGKFLLEGVIDFGSNNCFYFCSQISTLPINRFLLTILFGFRLLTGFQLHALYTLWPHPCQWIRVFIPGWTGLAGEFQWGPAHLGLL